MVTISQQMIVPMVKDESANPAGNEKTIGADSFLSFLDKSLSNPLHVLKSMAKAGENAAKPLRSTQKLTNNDVSGTRIVPREGNAKALVKQTTESQPRTDVDEPGNAVKTETKAVAAEVGEKTDETQDQNQESTGDSSAIERMQQCDQLLAIMDQIIQVLQQAANPAQKPEESSETGTAGISSIPEAAQMYEELQKLVSDLVATAEKMQGTKTAGHALALAKKLQQLLGVDSFEMLTREGLEISVSKSVNLEDLAGKMLHEAENVKMHLVQTSLQEIAIPAMKAEAPKAPPAVELQEQTEEAGEQPSVQKEKAFTPENPENLVSQEQAEDGIAEKPQLAKTRGGEADHPAELTHNTPADAAPNLYQPQNDMVTAVPETPQTFSKADVTAQIIDKAETMIREDKTEMILQLKPDSLGKISLKIIHERGEIIARFVAESEQVKAVLESNMQLLKDSLQKSGVMVQSLEVSVGQQGSNPQRGWDSKPDEGFARSEMKSSEGLKKSFVQPMYGYGGFDAGYYSGQISEIDLTA